MFKQSSFFPTSVVAFTFRLILDNNCRNKDKIRQIDNFVLRDLPFSYHNNKDKFSYSAL